MSQPLWHSIPYLCILLPLGSAAVTSVLKPRWARYWTMFALLVVTSLSGVISAIFASGAESYTYMMGHFPAPWGNEIRAGQLEAVTALFFSLIMLLSLLGGSADRAGRSARASAPSPTRRRRCPSAPDLPEWG